MGRTITRLWPSVFVIGLSLLIGTPARAADNCTGYDALVTISSETLEVGKGHTLTVWRAESMVTSDDSIYHLTTGECAGTTLATPDGTVRFSGHCARRDKDGDTYSVEVSQAPGAEKGMWKWTGGTGKFASGKDNSGWGQTVRTDGKMFVVQWGGTCK
jgi:hypothetical protein